MRQPSIPFVISVSDSLIRWPSHSSASYPLELCQATLNRFPIRVGVPRRVPVEDLQLDKNGSDDLERFLADIAMQLHCIQPLLDADWQFLQTALNFRSRAFLTKGSDELLWNITAIEAILGDKAAALGERLDHG